MSPVKKILFAVALFCIQLSSPAQTNEKRFPVGQLQHDYKIFVQSLREAHPGLYRYTSKKEFDSLFSATKSKIDRPLTEEEFFKLLAPLIAKIKCGHTKFSREGNPDDRYAFKKNDLFPLKLYFVNDRAYVLYSYSLSPVKLEAMELLAINNTPVKSIIDRLHNYMAIDGDVRSAFYEELNHSFNGYYATFMETRKSYNLTYRQDGKILSCTMPGVNLETITAREQENVVESKHPLRLQYLADSIALLTIQSFFVEENVQQYYPFIDSVFKELKVKNTRNLIIDVRNNEGGEEDFGGYLFSYLTNKDFLYYNKLTLTQKDYHSVAKYAEMPPQLSYLQKFIEEKNGEILFTGQKYLSVQPPQENTFTGKVYMLINGLSFSVTSELASVVHHNKRATFVGEETGGAYYGNNSGVFAIVHLPITKLTIGIPLVGFYSNVSGYPYKNHGIMPDYPVSNSVIDILNKKDAVIAYTLQLIQTKK